MTYLADLMARDKDDLANELYNRMVSDLADYAPNERDDPHGHGKRIPYIGWYWRDTDFVHRRISIGNCGAFVGVMENNKWDYPEREMTPDEAETFIAYLERACAATRRGGNVADNSAVTEAELRELWAWFQTLTVRE